MALGVKAAVCVNTVPFHVYVLAPLALKVACVKAQTVAEAGAIERIGKLKVANDTVLLLIHPTELVAATV